MVGFHKGGLRIALTEEGSAIELRGEADPFLPYVVIGTALAVMLGGTVVVSPQYGLSGVLLLGILFLPLLAFTILGAVRLRTRCAIDRAGRAVEVDERSYAGRFRRRWSLDDLRAVTVATRPAGGWASGGPLSQLLLEFGGEQYLALSAVNELPIRRAAQRLALFVGVPIRAERLPVGAPGLSGRKIALVAAAFALPLLGCGVALAIVFSHRPTPEGLLVVSMAALVLCQVGALLAYGYDRSRPGPVPLGH